MKLRLRYTNQAQQSVILYKYDNTISRTVVSKSPIDALAQRYIWDMAITTVTGGKKETLESATPGASFTVLYPGQFYDAKGEITVFVRRTINSKESDGLLHGDHFYAGDCFNMAGIRQPCCKFTQAMASDWFAVVRNTKI